MPGEEEPIDAGPIEDLSKGLVALGAGTTKYDYNGPPVVKTLEKFPNPNRQQDISKLGAVTVDILAPEFTCLCPKTGQPDFATIEVSYFPDKWCVESKSLKLYLGQFRGHGEFHEAAVNRIGSDLVTLLQPYRLVVVGKFFPRGGIKFWPTYQYQKAASNVIKGHAGL